MCIDSALRVLVDVLGKIVMKSAVKDPSRRIAAAHMKFRDNYLDMLIPLVRLLQQGGKLDRAFAPAIEMHSKDGFTKPVDLTKPAGQES